MACLFVEELEVQERVRAKMKRRKENLFKAIILLLKKTSRDIIFALLGLIDEMISISLTGR